MKKISIVIPTYNEEANVEKLAKTVTYIMTHSLAQYDYEIIFIDNFSKDRTRSCLRTLCQGDLHIKAIFNAQNFGYLRSPYYAITQSTGDCTILMSADFQDPPDLIPEFIKNWESGYKIVIAQKIKSQESKLMYALREIYYKFLDKISEVHQIKQFTCFGLYDKSFVSVLRSLDDSRPYMRGIVSELGMKMIIIPFTQPVRNAGKSSSNFKNLYDQAMLGITSYSKIGLRSATFLGIFIFLLVLFVSVIFGILHLLTITNILIILCMLIGSLILFYIGIMGEYILNMNIRLMNRPLVVEEERINFEQHSKQ